MNKYIIYSDGSLKGNYLNKDKKPLKGGWASIICDENNNIITELFGGFINTTSPRMELMGVLNGLKYIQEPSDITVVSDSQYVVNTIEDNWIKTILEKPDNFSNVDLWVELARFLQYHKVHMIWIKGHADNILNNYADKLAQFAAKCLNLPEDEYINYSEESRKSLVSKFETRRSNGFDIRSEDGTFLYSLG